MLKDVVITEVNEMLAPVRARPAEYVCEPGYARQVLRDGNEHANAIASVTFGEVRAVMGHRLMSERPLARGLFACGTTSAGQGWRHGIL